MLFETIDQIGCMKPFLKISKASLFLIGLWPIKKSKISWLYNLYKYCFVFGVSHLCLISMTIAIFQNRKNYLILAEASLIYISYTLFVIKLHIFNYNHSRFVNLLHQLYNPMFHSYTPQQEKLIKNWSNYVTAYIKCYFGVCIICTCFFAACPLIDSRILLPLRGWFPFEITKSHSSLNYNLAYIFQVLGLVCILLTNSHLDSLPTFFMNIACSQMDVLNDNLQSATENAENETQDFQAEDKETIQLKKNLKDSYMQMLSKKSDMCVQNILKKCTEHHLAILELLDGSQKTFSYLIFAQFLASVIILCITEFELMVVDNPMSTTAVIISYFIAVSTEISIFCWNGNLVIEKSSTVRDSCYNMCWYRCSTEVRRSIFIIMERCKRPVEMTAGNYFVLSIQTLTAIVRTSYSFFTVLKEVYKD